MLYMKNKKIKRFLLVTILLLAMIGACIFLLTVNGSVREEDGLMQHSRISIEEICIKDGVLFYTIENGTPRRLRSLSNPRFQKKTDGEWTDVQYETLLHPTSGKSISCGGFRSDGFSHELQKEECSPGEYRFYLSNYDGQNGVEREEQFFIVGYYVISE